VRVRAELTRAEVVVLVALNEPGTRWHRLAGLAAGTGLDERTTASALAELRRHCFAVESPWRGEPAWSTTELGTAELELRGSP
jgi:hypothetical protein